MRVPTSLPSAPSRRARRRAAAAIARLAGLLLMYGSSTVAASACVTSAAAVGVSDAHHPALSSPTPADGDAKQAGGCAVSTDHADCGDLVGASCAPLRSESVGVLLATLLLAGLACVAVRLVRAGPPTAPGSRWMWRAGIRPLDLACVSRT